MPPSTALERGLEEVKKVYDSSATPVPSGHPIVPRSSNAKLDPEALTVLFRRMFSEDIQVSTLNVFLTSKVCQVLYAIDKAGQPQLKKERVLVEITQCPTMEAAEAEMKDYLLAFQSPLSELASSANIGRRSLQTANSVFWVRDTVFAKLISEDIGGVSQDPKSTRTPPSKVSPAPAPLISTLAKTLDKYLDDYAVSPGKQLKPQMAIRGPSSITATEHEVFAITLTNASSLHKIKPIEIEKQDIVIPTGNGSPSGEYTLYALKAGKTKVKVVAAHESSLAVGYEEVEVTVFAKS